MGLGHRLEESLALPWARHDTSEAGAFAWLGSPAVGWLPFNTFISFLDTLVLGGVLALFMTDRWHSPGKKEATVGVQG